ncbi:hypothetical protein [Amycolatopsis speibonae]|uniref:Carbohydrate kinase PfkB domain-containing protein n=1 Tax=Amycolatopsis speibonae TaxID=1450224 RepID=A0ABV7P5I3_9PSEU
MLLLIGRDLVAGDTALDRDGALPARVTPRLAGSGSLAAGIVAFRSGNRHQPPAARRPRCRRHQVTGNSRAV